MTVDIGLTVYGPEVAKSGLTADLDTFIAGQTGLKTDRRFFALHDAASITAFYTLTGSTSGAHWPLVCDLFDLRPVCVTLWRGRAALAKLQAIKGRTQPAEAAPGTVRSRFWCDNPVTNLIHVSDDAEIMERERAILSSRSIGSDDRGWRALASGRMAHNSLAILCRLLAGRDRASARPLPADGDARDTTQALMVEIGRLVRGSGREGAIQLYLRGDMRGLDSLLADLGQVSGWDRLILSAGLFAMPYWRAALGTPLTRAKGAVA